MSVTEILFGPLVSADPGRPLITHYDDAAGSRIELSRATVRNWAAKTANWLRDEHDVQPGDPVAVLLPAHWQTVGVLLGAWWCGAHVVTTDVDAAVAVVPPGGSAAADVVAVASLHPMGLGSGAPVDYNDDVRVHGDDFKPWSALPGSSSALDSSTVDSVVSSARSRAASLGVSADSRVMSTLDWPGGLLDGFLAVLAGGGSLVQVSNPDAGRMPARRDSEKITLELGTSS